jgi:hypothetical protein
MSKFYVVGPFETAEDAQALIDSAGAGTLKPGVRVLEFDDAGEPPTDATAR